MSSSNEVKSAIAPSVPGYHEFLPATANPDIGQLWERKSEAAGGVKGIQAFEPISIRGVEFKNRIWASPMCMYSADEGRMTDWHVVHYGSMATRGVGAICVEASAVVPEGRICPQDLGLWSDEQIAPAKRVVDFCHAHGTKIGVQIGHAGRKASMPAPWLESRHAIPEEAGGWPENVHGPSAIQFTEGYPQPKEATQTYLDGLVQSYAAAVKRCIAIGYDFIEIHGAHGYLLHSFVSPISNHRTDQYGGSFENRIRYPLEVTRKVREVWGDRPLFYRLSASDWAEGPERVGDEYKQWGVEQSIRLSVELQKVGVDLIDTSSGGATIDQKIAVGPGYQVPFADSIKKAVPDILVGAVGLLTTATQIETVLRKKQADVVFVARELLRNIDFVLDVAQELGAVVRPAVQYERAHTRLLDARNAEQSPFKQ